MRVAFAMIACLVLLLDGACGNAHLNAKLVDAAAEGDTARVQELLDKGADINAHARDDWTPLTISAREGRLQVVKLLLRRGVSVNEKEGGGHTALFWARKYQRGEVESALIEAGGKNE